MICFPLDATDYSANALGAYLCTRTRGVFSAENNLEVTVANGMNVIVSAGLAWLRMSKSWGTVALSDSDAIFTLKPADGVLSRIDVAVCRIDKINNRAELIIRTGAFAGKPIYTPPIRDDNYDEIYLASILIEPGMVEVKQASITQLHLDESVCGLMRDGVTGIPTAALQTQVQQLIDSLRAEILGIEKGSEVMLNSIYDPKHTGTVLSADNADKLGGNLPSYYQPQADSGYYLQERLTGNTWIDGKPIYTKTIVTSLPTPPANKQGLVTQGFDTGSVNIINYQVLVRENSGMIWDSSGLAQIENGTAIIWFRTLLTSYSIYYTYSTAVGIMTPYTVYLTLKYTK